MIGDARSVAVGSDGPPATTEEGCQRPFYSILFKDAPASELGKGEPPECFGDFHLDQIIESITAGRGEYDLKPFFYVPLKNVDAIYYRHEVLRDLENAALLGHIRSFSEAMRLMRGHLAQAAKLYYQRQKESWFRDAVEIYCEAVKRLYKELASTALRSSGFKAFREFLGTYAESAPFLALVRDTEKLKADLAGIRYSLQIAGKRIKVGRYESESDYGAEVLQTFEKFKQAEAKEYRFEFHATLDMNHVEAAILDLVAKLYPATFAFLDEYCNRHAGYLNSTVAAFDREVQFYLAVVEFTDRFKRSGLAVCYPAVSDQSKDIHGRGVFDMALANRLIRENAPVVTNDLHLQDPERIIVVSGPNQGGKTTFARAFGQLHYLASIGCPVAGEAAQLFLFDKLFAHFEREEDARNLTGKLEDELLRIRRILDEATPRSILVMNESFLSTTLDDAIFLSKRVMERVIALDMLCVSVTFLDELASLGKTTVSMVGTVDPGDPAIRTFKIVRKPADGLAYAVAIAKKYGLTFAGVKTRIAEKQTQRAPS
jgi:DNA mismatch repair protein MutS